MAQGKFVDDHDDYELKRLAHLSRDNKYSPLSGIQKCIGQLLVYFGEHNADDGGKILHSGTATVYKRLGNGYYLLITSAHQFYCDHKKAQKIWFLCEGAQNRKLKCKCIEWVGHDEYNAALNHCPNDIGIILCYDSTSYYENMEINACIHITVYKRKRNTLRYCHIYGYPVKSEGKLMGMIGNAFLDSESGEWEYRDLYTYPGQSGAVIYTLREYDDEEEHFYVYGVHVFGDTQTQQNRGVCFSEEHIKWLEHQEAVMKQKATDDGREKEQTEEKTDLKQLLESMQLGEYYQMFQEHGFGKPFFDIDNFTQLVDADLKEIGVKRFFHRRRILEAIQMLVDEQKTDEESKMDSATKALETIDRNDKHPSFYDCIGQILTDFGHRSDDGMDNLLSGTGIVIKKLPDDHVIVLTSVCIIEEYSPITGETEKAKKSWFFPRGVRESKCRLKYVSHEIYSKYEPEVAPCPDDLALVLFKDRNRVLDDIEVNEVVQIIEWKDIEKSAIVSIYGYPVESEGVLQGCTGKAKWTKRGFWAHKINTYPGDSGAPIFGKVNDEKYGVYGIHIWGDVVKQEKYGVFLDLQKVKWIKATVADYESELTNVI